MPYLSTDLGIWLLIDYSLISAMDFEYNHNLCYFVAEYAVFMQKMLFVALLLCDFMQIVLILCKLCCFPGHIKV